MSRSNVVWLLLLIAVAPGGCGQTETDAPFPATAAPTLQPSPGQIAFTSTRDNGGGTIYIINSDGTNLTRVTSPELYAVSPQWGPQCKRITFSAKDGIYTISPEGTDLERIIPLSALSTVSQSFDGEHLAFSVSDPALPHGANIWIASSTGTEIRQLTNCPINCGAPIWHPSGEWIYYFSDENDYTDPPIRSTVNRITVSRSTQETLLSTSETVDIPVGGMTSLSPDGTRFVLVREMDKDQHTDIFTFEIEARVWRRLTRNQAYYDQPAWSPDGQQIVFVSYHVPIIQATRAFPSTSGIWIMNADGSGGVQIVPPEGKNLEPVWCNP